MPDPLSLYAAIDALRRQPDCVDCREVLRALLWPLLPRPAASTLRRNEGDAQGLRYLDAVRSNEVYEPVAGKPGSYTDAMREGGAR